jgi:hypothetical protein
MIDMRLLRLSRLLGRTTSRLLGKTLAFLAPLALKLGVTQRVLFTLIGVGVAVVLMLVLLAVGRLG